jgi:Arc/MetJ-type ribon-helix-helix transcriptional regulator
MTQGYPLIMGIVNVRISGEAEQALKELTADGTSTSDAVRRALLDAVTLRRREQMRAEALRSMADPADREALRQAMEEWADLDPG